MPRHISGVPYLFPEKWGSIEANAWAGAGPVAAALSDRAGTWAVRDHFQGRPRSWLAAGARPGTDWLDPRVGWGLVLADDPQLPLRERGRADDAPEPARRLAAARSSSGAPVVLRYAAGDLTDLYRYRADGTRVPVPTAGTGDRGAGTEALPQYLLLLGTPQQIPWELQFVLNHVCSVGRLDLDEMGLENYVRAALSSWAGESTDATSPLVWGVEHGARDITALMREEVGGHLLERWRGDTQIGDRAIDLGGDHATVDELADTLAERHPGVVVSTSHGVTGPAEDPARMRNDLGKPVDVRGRVLEPDRLLETWQPDGVVWFALACCSAGGSGHLPFEELLDPGSPFSATLAAVADLGPASAPLPTALLGAQRPARAVIGHVEPTFNWTLRRPDTGVSTTAALIDALYDCFFQERPLPVGPSFKEYFGQAAGQHSRWQHARNETGRRSEARGDALLAALTGIDRQCTVILGDPAVAPAALPTR